MDENVKVPLTQLREIKCFMESLDTSGFVKEQTYWHSRIIWLIEMKLRKTNLRTLYSEMLQAQTDDEKSIAQKNYVWAKMQIDKLIKDRLHASRP